MPISLKNVAFNIWKSKYDRQGIKNEYKPIFTRYVGVDNVGEYNDVLKTIYEKSQQCPYSVFFDGSIPLKAEFDIITYVGTELKTMDVYNLKTQDIVLFDKNETLNKIFLEALDYVVNLALKQETFFNESVRNDFILKLIVWTYSYIRPIYEQFEDTHSPKCFYYGDITRHEVYFLMMLYLMTFDVVYINPLRDEVWSTVDTIGLSKLKTNPQIVPIDTLQSKIVNASVIDVEESITLQMQQEMEETLLSNSGVYRAWQFRDGDVNPLFIRSTVIDLMHNYEEPSRVRTGFKVNGKMVTIPNYLFQIDGQYKDKNEYYKLVQMCISTPNTLVLSDRGESLITRDIPDVDKFKLTFCRLSDGSYDINEIKKLSYYEWDKYRDSLEDFILRKINVLFNDCMFKKKLDQNDQFNLIADILSMNESVIKMADAFDFTDKVPKLVIFLDNEEFISDRTLYLLGFIFELGFDIIIFSPAGLISIDSVFELNRFNNERLDEMCYNCTLEDIKKKKKNTKNLLQRLFG